jgi:drug/metabolite transporter (DMT)-like permease
MSCWFYTISVLPLQEAVSLNFLTPILTILAGQLFLQERVNKYTYFACLLSFIGVVIILRPGFKNISSVYLVPLASVLLWVISNLIVKLMTKTEKPTTIVAYMSIFMLIFSIPLGIMHLQKITIMNLFWFIILGLVSNLSHIYVAKAYSVSDLATVSPLDFTRLVFVSIIAYFMFNEKPDFYVFIGSAIILVAMILISKKPKIINNFS